MFISLSEAFVTTTTSPCFTWWSKAIWNLEDLAVYGMSVTTFFIHPFKQMLIIVCQRKGQLWILKTISPWPPLSVTSVSLILWVLCAWMSQSFMKWSHGLLNMCSACVMVSVWKKIFYLHVTLIKSDLVPLLWPNASINFLLQHLPPFTDPSGIWAFEDWFVQIPVPLGLNYIQMLYPIAELNGEIPLPKNKCIKFILPYWRKRHFYSTWRN